jgi:hypothetical protein
MSNQVKGPICRQTYFNQGSYLRARDNEKQICNVITEIQNGTIIPYIVSHGGVINGNLTVKGDVTVTGNLNVNGNLSYAGNISLGNSCSDIIAVGGTATFSCPTTFNNNLTITQSNSAADQSNLIIQSDAVAAVVPTVTGVGVTTVTLIGRSSNTCGTISYIALTNLGTITLSFADAKPVTPVVQITLESVTNTHESIHLTSVVASTSFTVTNTGLDNTAGIIHYFVVDMGV